jgi:epoxyqueuosine reductase
MRKIEEAMVLFEKIKQLGEIHAIDLVGVAEIGQHHKEIERIGGKVSVGFPRALSIGIVLPGNVVDLLRDRETYENAFQYKTHAYEAINLRLDNFASIIGSTIQKNGYRVMPIPAAERIDSIRVCASISHKLTARLAGFGWIGKNCLLIHPTYGPRVRWTTVLTDAPFEEHRPIMENRCRDCDQCVKACPARALKGRNFVEGELRDLRFEVAKCEAHFEKLRKAKKLAICGMCLYACSYGGKTKKMEKNMGKAI